MSTNVLESQSSSSGLFGEPIKRKDTDYVIFIFVNYFDCFNSELKVIESGAFVQNCVPVLYFWGSIFFLLYFVELYSYLISGLREILKINQIDIWI